MNALAENIIIDVAKVKRDLRRDGCSGSARQKEVWYEGKKKRMQSISYKDFFWTTWNPVNGLTKQESIPPSTSRAKPQVD